MCAIIWKKRIFTFKERIRKNFQNSLEAAGKAQQSLKSGAGRGFAARRRPAR